MEACLRGDEASKESPCREIVLHQWPDSGEPARRGRWQREHHLPEPWVGHLEDAPLLFLSSNPGLGSFRPLATPDLHRPPALPELRGRSAAENPSLRKPFESPKWDWDYDEIVDRYESAFELWLDEGTRPIKPDGTIGRRVPYWAGVKESLATCSEASPSPAMITR